MTRTVGLFTVVLSLACTAWGAGPDRVLEAGKQPDDSRLGKPRTLHDKDFFLRVPAAKEAWEKRRQEVREQVLVANGLWPMPRKTVLQPVIHGKIDRDDYTIEKVYFASYPGHYVTGNLYRPKGKSGKRPAVLNPHGHWPNGRFLENKDADVKKQLDLKGERTPEGARYPLQAKCAQLARMGCVVFLYDMVGYADSKQIGHAAGFRDADAELRLQSAMGLQTFNSIRALDFLRSLPDVDPQRIGVTGASGGGTQTFILCAVDDRPAVAFPAVMVSTAMQGGCVCENCTYLRQETGNIELAGLFAPKPLAMSGANDWTIDIEKKGLPELKDLYKLYDAEDKVQARCWPQFGHNYNQVSREFMYAWFNKHLALGLPEPVTEKPFVPVPPKELSVFDDTHPLPQDAVDVVRLRQQLAEESDRQLRELQPKDVGSLREFRRVVGAALRVMIHDQLPGPDAVEEKAPPVVQEMDGVRVHKLLLGRKGYKEQVPALSVRGPDCDGAVVIWIDPAGKSSLFHDGKLNATARSILSRKAAILAPDVFLTGELSATQSPTVDPKYAGYTFGYNRPLSANRVHDILTTVAYARNPQRAKTVHLVGFDKAGPWVLLARALCGDAVERTAADLDQFRFEKVTTTSDAMMLPGALKYGGLPAFAALCAPGKLLLHNTSEPATLPKAAFQAANAADQLHIQENKAAAAKVVDWLLPLAQPSRHAPFRQAPER